MLERALTTQCCSEIIGMLISKRGWTIHRMAKIIRATPDYVRRVQLRKQSFQVADVEALAAASGQHPRTLIFDSIRRDKMSPGTRGLYDLALKEIKRHGDFRRAIRPKTSKKRRVGTKAA